MIQVIVIVICICEFLFVCWFAYFIVCRGYSKCFYEFMFLIYLVMDHMYCRKYVGLGSWINLK